MGNSSTGRDRLETICKSFGVLVSGMVIVYLQSGSFKALGVLYEDIVRQYGSSQLFTGWALSFQSAATFAIAGITGSALNRCSNRLIGIIGGFLFGLGFVLQGIFGHILLHLFIFTGVTAVGAGSLLFSSYMSFMENFGEAFSLAYSIRELFTYLGVTFMPPMMELFREKYGLHGSFLITGAVIWNSMVSGVLMKSANSSKCATTDLEIVASKKTSSACYCRESAENETHSTCLGILSIFSMSPAIHHPEFALFLIVHSLFSYHFVVWALFLVPFATSLGFPPEVAVFLSTAGGVGGFFGKITVSVLFYMRRMNIFLSSFIPAILYSVALILYMLSDSFKVLLAASFISGFAIAFADAALNGTLPRYICESQIKQGTVISYIFTGISMQLGGIISGAILDATSSFALVFGVMLIFNILIMVVNVVMHNIITRTYTS